jgi:hypothetical protein
MNNFIDQNEPRNQNESHNNNIASTLATQQNHDESQQHLAAQRNDKQHRFDLGDGDRRAEALLDAMSMRRRRR